MLQGLQTFWPKQDLILIRMNKLYSSTKAHQLTITQAILGPTPSLRSCRLIVYFQTSWSRPKALKADISRPEIQREINNRDEARRQGIPLGHYRTQLLMEALQLNGGTITVAKCTQWFCFMQTYLPRCINREVIAVLVRIFFSTNK